MCGPASTAAPACRGAQDADGNPVVSPTTVDYTGIKLGDVQGWAPTPGTFGFNKNYCVAGAPQFTGVPALMCKKGRHHTQTPRTLLGARTAHPSARCGLFVGR